MGKLELQDQDKNAAATLPAPSSPHFKIQKKVVRRAKQDGFFKTGVEVLEDEEIDIDATANNAAQLLKDGKVGEDQIREMLERKLKEDRIFGFKDF